MESLLAQYKSALVHAERSRKKAEHYNSVASALLLDLQKAYEASGHNEPIVTADCEYGFYESGLAVRLPKVPESEIIKGIQAAGLGEQFLRSKQEISKTAIATAFKSGDAVRDLKKLEKIGIAYTREKSFKVKL